jgi:hypothetical protein
LTETFIGHISFGVIRYPLRGYDYGMGASLAGTQARVRLKRGDSAYYAMVCCANRERQGALPYGIAAQTVILRAFEKAQP